MRGRTSVPPTTPSLRRSKHPSLLTVCAYAVSHRLQHSDALTQRFLFALLVQMKTQFKDGQKEIMGHMEILAFHSKSNHIRKHGRVCNRYCSHMWCACVSHSPAQCSFIIRSCQDTFSQRWRHAQFFASLKAEMKAPRLTLWFKSFCIVGAISATAHIQAI